MRTQDWEEFYASTLLFLASPRAGSCSPRKLREGMQFFCKYGKKVRYNYGLYALAILAITDLECTFHAISVFPCSVIYTAQGVHLNQNTALFEGFTFVGRFLIIRYLSGSLICLGNNNLGSR